ncbi:MAG: hypothetical protein Q8P41_20205 [Pseudomonadota bacterium]|nr:hypothetical protein [Pseudomonadota bacterium]
MLDFVRVRGLRALGPVGVTIASRRAPRVALVGVVAAVTALLSSAVAPIWAFAFGPLLLGLPHVLADLRYLVVRPGLLATPARLAVALAPVLAAWVLGAGRSWAFAAIATTALAVPDVAWRRRLLGVGLGAALVALGLVYPRATAFALLHLHNLVAFGFWLAWRRRAGWANAWVVGAVGLGAALLLSGAADPVALALPLPAGIDPLLARDWVAPGIADPWAGRILRLFVYFQALHYAVWLRLVPEEDRPREAARTWRRDWRELVGDIGRGLAVATVAGTVGLLAWGWFDATAARDAYLQIALFHGFLEFAVAAWWLLAGTRPVDRLERLRPSAVAS